MTEFVGIKKRLLNVRTAVKDMIVSTDRDIARTALLANGLRKAVQTVNNAFRTFADKPEVDYSQKEQKHPFTKAVLAPMKAVKKLLVSMELHLDASIDKLDNLAMNVQFDKEKRMEHTKDKDQKAPDTEREIIYSSMVAEPQEYKYNAAGKGFAVVADQIRNLAEQSAKSAVDSKALIEAAIHEVGDGNIYAEKATTSLREVVDGIQAIEDSAKKIKENSIEQADSMEQVEATAERIAEVVQNNSAAAQETSATSEELTAQATTLSGMVSVFKLRQ